MPDRWRIRWSGKFDLRCEWDGRLWFLDRKTTSRDDQNSIKAHRVSTQFKGYTFAARELYGKHFAGGLVDTILWRSPLKREAKPGGKAPLPRDVATRTVVTFTAEQIARWRHQTLGRARDILGLVLNADDKAVFPSREHNCIGKYGPCPFFQVCDQPTLMQERSLLMSDFYRQRESAVAVTAPVEE